MSETNLMNDDSLSELLQQHGFDVSTMRRLHSGPGCDDLWTVRCRNDREWFADWELLRGLVKETGRWPVAGERKFGGDVEGHLQEFGERDAYDAQRTLESAAIVDFWAELPELDATYYRENDPAIGPETKDAFDRFFDLLPYDPEVCRAWKDTARKELDHDADPLEIQRWAVHRVIKDPKPADADCDPWHIVSELRTEGENPWITLLPTSDPVAGLAYVASFGVRRPDLRVAVAREWNRKHGVEFVGVFAIGDLFRVETPPSDPDDIWDVARAAFALWPDIDAGFKGSGHPVTLAAKLPFQHRWSFTIYP